jgi:hypothetical protein
MIPPWNDHLFWTLVIVFSAACLLAAFAIVRWAVEDTRAGREEGRHVLPQPSRALRTATPNLPGPVLSSATSGEHDTALAHGRAGELNYDPSLAIPVAYYTGRSENQRQLAWDTPGDNQRQRNWPNDPDAHLQRAWTDDTGSFAPVTGLPAIRQAEPAYVPDELGGTSVTAVVDYLFSGLEHTRWAGAA